MEDFESIKFWFEEDICPSISLTKVLVIVITVFMIMVLIIVCMLYKETIQIFVFSQIWGKIFCSENQVDKNKAFDAFVSYSGSRTLFSRGWKKTTSTSA